IESKALRWKRGKNELQRAVLVPTEKGTLRVFEDRLEFEEETLHFRDVVEAEVKCTYLMMVGYVTATLATKSGIQHFKNMPRRMYMAFPETWRTPPEKKASLNWIWVLGFILM